MNKILVQNLVRIKPTIDNKPPISLANKKTRQYRSIQAQNRSFEDIKNQTQQITAMSDDRGQSYSYVPRGVSQGNPNHDYAFSTGPVAQDEYEGYTNQDENWAALMMHE